MRDESVAVATGLLGLPAFGQTPAADAARTLSIKLFAGTWEVNREPPNVLTPTNCATVQFAFLLNCVTVECSFKDASGREVRTVDLYHRDDGSAYPFTLQPDSLVTLQLDSFVWALTNGRILELHDIKDRNVVRVRWYEASTDGSMITATSRPSTRPIIYRKQQ